MKRSKAYREAASSIDSSKAYAPLEAAMKIVEGTARSMGLSVN